jgi:uncharacterized protein
MTPDDDIAAFDGICRQLAGFDARLSSEWIDGYLSALVAGPRVVPIDEWLPKLAGDAFERAFADPDDVARAMSALRARRDGIVRELDAEALADEPDTLRLRPVLLTADEDDPDAAQLERWIGAPWAGGFMQALDDFADDWRMPARADTGAQALFKNSLRTIAALQLEDDALAAFLREAYRGQTLSRDELIDEACYAAQELRLFWVDHAPRHPPRRVEATPGRNDPCPCGSGKKWKRCHGA